MEEEIKMRCVFCKSDQFELPGKDHQPNHGEMVKCANCARLNDYTSILKIAEEHAIDLVKAEAERMVKDALKSFKM